MPILNVATIHSFSSEDPAFPASNLLTKTNRKWRCSAAAASQSAYVCLQLPRASRITGIDIGNEFSAHIAVQVARQGAAADTDFHDLLLATTFMSNTESRSASNFNRVRCFHGAALVEAIASGRWQLVRIQCTQPYSSQSSFGLAFVKVHAAAEVEAETEATVSKPLVPAGFLAATAAAKTSTASPFAKFKMRRESSESDSESAATLFARWKQAKHADGLRPEAAAAASSTAAAIRDAATPAALAKAPNGGAAQRFTPKVATSVRASPAIGEGDEQRISAAKSVDRNRRAILYDSDDERPNERLDKKLQHDLQQKERAEKAEKAKKPAAEAQRPRAAERSSDKFRDFLDDADKSSSVVRTPAPKKPAASSEAAKRFSPLPVVANAARKRTLSPQPGASGQPAAHQTPAKKTKVEPQVEKPVKPIVYKAFRKLLEGVVLVISGIQNPARAQIRDKALEMGAKYKPDWEGSCTHLICAFRNTPKYNQVHGLGKIIRADWITACHAQRKRLPWRRFALDAAEKLLPESEDELVDEAEKPAEAANPAPVVVVDLDDAEDTEDDPRYSEKSEFQTGVDLTPEKNAILSSGSDTEDEIDRAVERQKKRDAHKKARCIESETDDSQDALDPSLRLKPKPVIDDDDDDDAYSKTTDEERRPPPGGNAKAGTISPLPEFFAAKRFYLSSNLSSVETLKLQRYVQAYGGQLIRNAAEADYIVSNKGKQLSADFAGEVVRPLWVFECNDMECLLPTKRYKFD